MARRMMTRAAVAAIASSFVIAGCATQPEPCTPEWVEWKTDRILTEFARGHRDTVRDLQDVSGDVENPTAIMAVRLAALLVDVEDLARDFDRIVLPELNDAVEQCGQPRDFIPAFTQFLRKEGVDEDVIGWVETIGYIASPQGRQ